MSWIDEIPYDQADPSLKRIYDRVKGPNNNVDNVLSVHSLRPHSLVGHMTLYKNVLHNANNTLPKWYLETQGVYVSQLNNCSYCVEHHFAGLRRLLGDDSLANKIREAIDRGSFDDVLDDRMKAGMGYAVQLTREPHTLNEQHISDLRKAGFSDGEILEINQVVSYFNYVNRSVLGLGVNIKGDVLGLSPGDSDDPENWSHD